MSREQRVQLENEFARLFSVFLNFGGNDEELIAEMEQVEQLLWEERKETAN